MATTAGDLITAAFLKCGVESPTTAQTTSALISLNNMVSSWGGEKRYPSRIIENFTLTSGDREYTIGSGGDFNTVRPDKIESAFLRDSNSYDWPLEIISAKDVNSVVYKATEARPEAFYFIPEITLAKIYFECEPDYAYGFYIESWKNFTEFAATTTNVTLPNEYKEAIIYNLAVSLAEDWDRIINKTVIARANETKYLIDSANAGTRVVPKASFDMLIGHAYNITTDE